MKKYILLSMIVFGCATRMAAQSQHDYSSVMQKCLELKELQQYYPRAADGKIKQLNILRHGEPFPASMNAAINGQKPLFISKQDLKANGGQAYFMFHEFKIVSNAARIEFLYQFNNADNTPGTLLATIDLEMSGNAWTITQRNIELR